MAGTRGRENGTMVDIVEEGDTPEAAVRNIEQILRLEQEAADERSLTDRLADLVAGTVGSLGFVIAHCALTAGWVVLNTALVPGVPTFDPYPFGLLGSVLSLEGVILGAFVLMKQNRMSHRADERSHLDLQISLLAEQEITKMIQMLERMSRSQGIADQVMDKDAKEMASMTAVGAIAHHLHDKLPGDG